MDNPLLRFDIRSAYWDWAFFNTWVELLPQKVLLVWPSWRLKKTIDWVFLLTGLNREVCSEWWPFLFIKNRCIFWQNWVFNVIARWHQRAERTPTLVIAFDFHILASCFLLWVFRWDCLLVDYLSLYVKLFLWGLGCRWFLRGALSRFMWDREFWTYNRCCYWYLLMEDNGLSCKITGLGSHIFIRGLRVLWV